MTAKELNRDVKKLNAYIKGLRDNNPKNEDNIAFFRDLGHVAKPEFERIVGADPSFKSFNADSLRILLRLNLSHRFIPFHQFGLYIEI